MIHCPKRYNVTNHIGTKRIKPEEWPFVIRYDTDVFLYACRVEESPRPFRHLWVLENAFWMIDTAGDVTWASEKQVEVLLDTRK